MTEDIKTKIATAKALGAMLKTKHYHLGENAVVFDSVDDIVEAYASNEMAMDFTPNTFNTVSNGVPQARLTAWVKDIVKPVFRSYTYDKVGADFQQGDFETPIMQIPTLSYAGFMDAYVPGYDGQGAGSTTINLNYVSRNIQKLQIWLSYNELEEATMSAAKISVVNEKRTAMMNIIEQTRDDIFYYGLAWNTGVRGLLNDSNLNPVLVLPMSASNPSSSGWQYKSFGEKQDDLLLMFNELVANMVNNINVHSNMPMVLILAPNVLTYFIKQNDYEADLEKWFRSKFPNCEIITAIQYTGATGNGDNLMQLALKSINGQQTICHGYSYLLRAHRMEVYSDYQKQKYSIGDAGAVNRYPAAVVTSSGS